MAMSSEFQKKKDNYFTPGGDDAELQRELDEALGDMSLGDILDAEEKAEKGPAPAGKGVRKGHVVSIQGDDIFVDLGGRSEGLLPADQFADEPLPAVGDTVEVTIEGYDGADGLLLLSRKGAVLAATWQSLDEGQIVEARVTGHNKGGLELSLNGIPAFMPFSQVEMYRVEDLAPYVGRVLKCQVLEADPSEHKVVLSQRAVQELEAEQGREQMWQELAEGKILPGTVASVMPYGAFVDLGNGVQGLLHVSEMSHARVDDPAKLVKQGDKLNVQVVKLDPEARRIGLSLKHILGDPWDGAESKWPVDTVTAGRVTRLMDFGAFVELEPGVEGLVPIGELTFERRVNHPREIVSEGDAVKVRVMGVDRERKRISLSLKRVGDDPWMGASARWPEGSVLEGLVRRIADFGAFVEIVPGVEGLVHISHLSDKRVNAVGDAVREGQTVKVKVLEVDEQRRRMSLSIKEAMESAVTASAADIAKYTSSGPGEGETSGLFHLPGQAPKKEKKRKGGLD